MNIFKGVPQGPFENMCWSGVTEYRNEEQEGFKCMNRIFVFSFRQRKKPPSNSFS